MGQPMGQPNPWMDPTHDQFCCTHAKAQCQPLRRCRAYPSQKSKYSIIYKDDDDDDDDKQAVTSFAGREWWSSGCVSHGVWDPVSC